MSSPAGSASRSGASTATTTTYRPSSTTTRGGRRGAGQLARADHGAGAGRAATTASTRPCSRRTDARTRHARPDTDRWERKDWWGIMLEAPDPHALLVFWSAILDKPIWNESETRRLARPPRGGRLPRGPEGRHLRAAGLAAGAGQARACSCTSRSRSTDLEAAVAHAVELGATVADHQPQDDVRVMLDPAGHPFCLYT